MPIKELKCIEILMRFLVNKSDLKQEIYSEFHDLSIFENVKNNLFNYISINDLLKNFSLNQSFSLEEFLKNGTIPGMYPEKTYTPNEDIRYSDDYRGFYKALLEALAEGNYLFDDANNIFVSSQKLETTIPQVWLYRLAQATKRNIFQRMYFYNKNKENNITDKNDLIDYLRKTKTFLVEFISSNPNADYNVEFLTTEAKTHNQIKDNKEIKVDDIIETFKSNVSPDYKTNICKYKLADAYFIISKAEKLGRDFYSETLDVQQKYLNKWMLEYINSNERTNAEAQKFVLMATTSNIHGYDIEELNKKDVLIGLFNLYIKVLKTIEQDLEQISFMNFKIDEYVSPEQQRDLLELNQIIKRINSFDGTKKSIGDELISIDKEIDKLDLVKDKAELKIQKTKRIAILKRYNEQEQLEDELSSRRNLLQERIRIAKQSSIETIAFDNDLIMQLLHDCVNYGRVYFKQGTNQLVCELYNDDLGKTVFKATINVEKLIIFIENFNYKLEESYGAIKMS